jgi:hypothetical protein
MRNPCLRVVRSCDSLDPELCEFKNMKIILETKIEKLFSNPVQGFF